MKTQSHSSAATSINKTRLPAVYSRFSLEPGTVILDYGCGRYTDHIRRHAAASLCCAYLPYDPYNQPRKTNQRSLIKFAALTEDTDLPAVVVCSNVLNVIDNDDAVQAVADHLVRLATAAGGRALVTVYEGDGSGNGRETGPDQWQRNEKLREYLRFFPASARIVRSTIVIE